MANDVKWIKIVTDIFDDEKIRLIDALPDADTIIVIWFKLLVQAGKSNQSGALFINNKIAYTDEMLATIFNRKLASVRLALETFENLGMIERGDYIQIANWERHQNIEGMEKIRIQNRERKQRQRERQKQQQLPNHVMSRDSHAIDIELDIELELEKDIKRSVTNSFKKPSINDIKTYCDERNNSVDPQRFHDFYESKGWMVGKNKMKDWRAAVRNWERDSKSTDDWERMREVVSNVK